MAFNLCKLAKHYAMATPVVVAVLETVGFIFSGIWNWDGDSIDGVGGEFR